MSTEDNSKPLEGSSNQLNDQSKKPDSLSEKYKKWDQLAKETDEDPECDNRDELNKFFQVINSFIRTYPSYLFQQIYTNLDDDGRKAMMKSFTESSGTVLSTNWKEVGQKKVDVSAPEGMEYKKYDR